MEAGLDGVFYMELADALQHFESLAICEYRTGWFEERTAQTLRQRTCRFEHRQALLLSGNGQATISLHQVSARVVCNCESFRDLWVSTRCTYFDLRGF